jgi:hypothetical protein
MIHMPSTPKRCDEIISVFGIRLLLRHRPSRPVWRGVSKEEEDGCRPPALRVGHPINGRFGGGPPTGLEALGMADLGETLGSPWIPLAIRACVHLTVHSVANQNHGNWGNNKKDTI